MKKIVIFMLILLTSVFTACGENDNPIAPQTTQTDTDGNTAFSSAMDIDYNTEKLVTISNTNDQDFFKLTVTSNVKVIATFFDSTETLTATVFDGNFSLQIESDVLASTIPTQYFLNLYPGVYYVRIKSKDGTTGQLKVSMVIDPWQSNPQPGTGFVDRTGDLGYWIVPINTNVTLGIADSNPTLLTNVWFKLKQSETAPFASFTNDFTSPFEATFQLNDIGFYYFTTKAWRNDGVASQSGLIKAWAYVNTYTAVIDNGAGVYTLYVNPTNITPSALGKNIYLAGDMNGWGQNTYANNHQKFTNSSISGLLCVTITNGSAGQQYKLNIDYSGNGLRETNDWKLDPANYLIADDTYGGFNSKLP